MHVAYQVFGDGPVDLLFVPGFVSHIENYWDNPACARWLEGLASFSRVIMFDKRGTGLSDRVSALPGMDERLDDMGAVMDDVGIDQAAVMGISEGGSLATLFAASHPERCQALILYGAFARFTSWYPTEEALEELLRYIDTNWGSGQSLPAFAPGMGDDTAFREWWGRFERLGANPGAAITLMQMNSEIDITDILPSVHVPTLVIHRTDDVTVDFDAGELLAERIPDARLVALPGADHIPWVGENSDQIVAEIEEFLTGSRSTAPTDRVLATVLFTDIVDSTTQVDRLGDAQWRNLLETHDQTVRKELARFRGDEVKTLGDGFLVTFDGPGRAVRCALAISDAVKRLGLEIRAGLHTGEVELADSDVKGIAVHIASRVAGLAGAGEVVVSRTLKDLIAGSGITFMDFGTHSLKGIPDQWQLYRAHH